MRIGYLPQYLQTVPTSTELRKKLGVFLNDFETRHMKTLPKWLGDLDAFAGETNTIKDLFPGA